jgi:hypothetical protein
MNSISGTFIKMLLLLSGLLFFSVVHAEGNCPDGYYPLGTPGGGWQGCAPLPGNDPAYQHAPQEKWADQWMAIATDSVKGTLGTSIGMPDRYKAEQVAIADCQTKGGIQCKLDVSYGNGCAAMVVGDGGYNSNGAATLDKATRLSMKTCTNAGHTNCHVYYSACSLPKRIQ